jgi:hypothetical protein
VRSPESRGSLPLAARFPEERFASLAGRFTPRSLPVASRWSATHRSPFLAMLSRVYDPLEPSEERFQRSSLSSTRIWSPRTVTGIGTVAS